MASAFAVVAIICGLYAYSQKTVVEQQKAVVVEQKKTSHSRLARSRGSIIQKISWTRSAESLKQQILLGAHFFRIKNLLGDPLPAEKELAEQTGKIVQERTGLASRHSNAISPVAGVPVAAISFCEQGRSLLKAEYEASYPQRHSLRVRTVKLSLSLSLHAWRT